MKRDLSKQTLYEGVKTLVESPSPHIHLPQPKLFTLFSCAFNYLLFKASKNPGVYIIRIEDSYLADKISRKAKDPTSRQFMSRLLLPRKLRYQGSTFLLDFFHIGSWALTKEVAQEKLKGALVVKNTSRPVMQDELPDEESEEEDVFAKEMAQLPKHYYVEMLKSVCPVTVTIAFDEEIEESAAIEFPFIEEEDDLVSGVKIHENINLKD